MQMCPCRRSRSISQPSRLWSVDLSWIDESEADVSCSLSSVFLSGHRTWATLFPRSMARAKSDRSRSKTPALDDLTQHIEQLQAILPKVEDLGRDGFPYLEGSRARTELQIRECIKRIFGEKSPEFQTHRHLKLAIGPTADHRQSVTLIKHLIATLEDKKLEMQGLKPPASGETPTATTSASAPTAHPQMTLVPPITAVVPATESPVAPVAPPPTIAPIPPVTTVDTVHAAVAPSAEPTPAPVQPPLPIHHAEPLQVAVMTPNPQSIAPEQVSSLFRPYETGSVTPLMSQPQRPANVSPATPAPAPISEPAPPPTTPTPVPPTVRPPQFSATQEIPFPPKPAQQPPVPPAPTSETHDSPAHVVNHLDLCKRLGQRFHAIARQLRLRGEYRATVAIEDEIDVQDLLHALLRVQFDDIATDEWTPEYSSDAPRTTYLLDHDRLAIVVKKTRAGLTVKDLAEQLRLDVERYRTRERCSALFCFVYDPEGRIGNPRGLETDLSTINEHFTVDVLVAPK